MIRFAIPATLLLAGLAGCSDPAKTARYLIDPPPAGPQVSNRLGTAVLKDVSLPQYATSDEIAWQTEEGAVRSSPDNLWADGPVRGFSLSLARAISQVSGATVIVEPWPLTNPPDHKLDVRVETALAGADQVYRLSGRYFLSDETGAGTNYVRSFDIAVPLAGEGAGAIATAQSAAIGQLARQIATLEGGGTNFVTPKKASDPFALDPIF